MNPTEGQTSRMQTGKVPTNFFDDSLRRCFKCDKFSKEFESLGVLVSGSSPTCRPTCTAHCPTGTRLASVATKNGATPLDKDNKEDDKEDEDEDNGVYRT